MNLSLTSTAPKMRPTVVTVFSLCVTVLGLIAVMAVPPIIDSESMPSSLFEGQLVSR